ncbi:unannotated protein [freshwater metagenome]|uniref:Unannotated protein n=1 Tax=freshwater metagenome TaxID=449393 RepID=A0A6J7D2S7_9ZZZZ|nr:DUF4012 domain-containing protein [Actinomycetota bacterium]
MKSRRRNTISTFTARVVFAVAVASGVLAAFAGCRPTGSGVPDAVITTAFALFVTWASATAPWWALVVASSGAAMVVVDRPLLIAIALAGLFGGVWLGLHRTGAAPVRALIGAAVLQVVLRSSSDPWFLASFFAMAALALLLALTGLARRPGFVRRRVLHIGIGVGVAFLTAVVGMMIGGLAAKDHASKGYGALISGLNSLKSGDPAAASASLHSAAVQLQAARDEFDTPWTAPAQLVPVLAQHRQALTDIIGRAAAASNAASKTLALVDLSQLTVQTGVIDVEALALLTQPLADLRSTVKGLSVALDAASSPWLFAPFQDRLDHARTLASEVIRQADTSLDAAQQGPAMLGIDGPRRYFIAFTSSAEARGQTGLMGNWAEVTITKGRLKLTARGRTGELITDLEKRGGASLVASDEYFARYGQFGAGSQGGKVIPKYWSNITMSPDMPAVGSAMAQLYEQATGRAVDGVFIIDPAGIAALLDLTGDVVVPSLGVTLSSTTAEQFLLLDQYTRPESEREDILEAVTRATVDQVLSAQLPSPQVLAADLGRAATQGHLSAWAVRPSEQQLFEHVGIDAALPSPSGHDGLAVVNDNASANKIDSFLKREVRYEARFNQRTGRTTAVASVTMTNTAPSTGYPDYVIGNRLKLARGTNRTILSLYSPLALQGVTLDGVAIGHSSSTELGWNVYATLITLAPGQRVTVAFDLNGALAPGRYQLVYRPQPLRLPERLFAEVKNTDGATVAGFAGTLKRRSVLSGRGLVPWR